MSIGINFATLHETKWYEYLVRFLLGGMATVITGLIAKFYGPETGGLFLAFPAIFCASASLIEKHERRRKEEAHLSGTRRGKEAAALDAAGTVLGSIALAVFAFLIWRFIVRMGEIALVGGLVAWTAVSISLWTQRRKLRFDRR